MEDPVFKQKYQKWKLRVKLWEKDFKKKNGRIPSKYDIRDAPQEIRDSYKMYYKLKTSFLEDTLNDVLSDDGFDVLEMSQKEGVLDVSVTESINGGPHIPLDITKLVEQQQREKIVGIQENINNFSHVLELPGSCVLTNLANNTEGHVIREFEPIEQLTLNNKAWGPTVTKRPEEKEMKKITPKNLKPNFKEKLFENISYSKRNPRKSLPKSALGNSMQSIRNNLSESSNANKEVLPDLETILLQKAKEQQTIAGIAVNPLLSLNKSKENVKTQVDQGWLERNIAQNGIKTRVTKKVQKIEGNGSQILLRKSPVYGLSNLDVSNFLSTESVKEKFSTNPTFNDERENTESKTVEPAKIEEEPVEHNIAQKSFGLEDSNSDSVVNDSEEENESQEYRHIVKRRRVMSLTPPHNQKQNIKTARTKEKSAAASCCEKVYSLDPEEDEDYAEKERKSKQKSSVDKRKTTTAKSKALIKEKSKTSSSMKKTRGSTRKKNVRTYGESPDEELSEQPVDNNKPPDSDNSDTLTQKKTKTFETKRTRVSTRKTKGIKHDKDDELIEQPLNPEDIKYTLALERGEITSVPRLKLTDLDKADVLAQEYINTLAPLPNTAKSLKPVPVTAAEEKRALAKRKLEEKIASGKLNENFVTLNIQKKTFVRGKKTINYSKYKKKLWKHKKHIAALTGPNMDMRGCDGGTLKCFNCGQAGHFAQSCTIKGDSLLPLTAELEEDPSPFPTLEEAERMASQTAIAVHSRNIGKLPQAANSALYQMDKGDSDVETLENQSDEVSVTVYDSDNNSKNQEDNAELPMETDDELDDFDIDTATFESQKQLSPIKKYVGSKIPAEFLKAAGIDPNNSNPNNSFSQFRSVDPLYDLEPDGTVKEATPEVLEALKMFGHTNFRKGQDRAVMRILSGMSTLVTLSTGSGKSLCYQLPAYLYSKHKKSITLVISPLVSLMEDQVTGVPHFLRAHCLHTNQTPQQKMKVLKMIADGNIDVLLVSPEAVVAGERSTGFGSILRQLPPIAFACIDEAHCVSQWSHNFRPKYLMICKVLKQNLGVKCVLGLTATATMATRLSIINHLDITDGEKGVISDIPLPDNLILSVSKDENRDAALLQLLQSKRFEACHSIIVYCTRRDECERIACYLRTCLQDRKMSETDNVKRKRKRANWHAEPYHAGMPASRRRTIQNAFMNNELRIVVATVAFGMGINKPDIRAVIHYNMPRNFESYVQEVGRAGRDHKISHCHLFLDSNAGDKNELKRHIYANSLDRHVIRKLLQRIFVPCCCDKNLKDGDLKTSKTMNNVSSNVLENKEAPEFGGEQSTKSRQHICPGHEIGFSIEKTVEVLDIPEENISTLLCYMELDDRWCINVLSNAYIKAKVISYGGPKYLKYAAKECPPLAMAIAMEIKNGSFKEDTNIIEFSVIDVAAAIGWNSGVVKYQLKNLEWVQVNGYPKRSPITVSFYDLGFRIKAPGDFTTDEIDDALDTLYSRALNQEQTQLIQLQYVFQGLSSVAYNTYGPCCSESLPHDRSDQLKGIIRDYFRNDYPKDLKLEIDHINISDSDLEADVIGLINMYPENSFSGRNIAKIFHGIASPNYPAQIWHRCKFWRVHTKTDFNRIVRLANNVIVRRRT